MNRLLALTLPVCFAACSSSGPGADLPMTKPPVEEATPMGFGGSTTHTASLDSGDIRQRFFGAGPTNIFRILGDIDAQISDINSSSKDKSPACLTQDPVSYDLQPFGTTTTFWAQCYENAGTGFLQFGRHDNETYIFSLIGAGPVAVRVSPNATGFAVHAWIGIGDGKNTGGSYGVIEVQADPSTHSFEMAVAGTGFGYCGAQVKSDGTAVYATGSIDMGTTCNEVDTLCVAASDLVTPATCTPSVTTFGLTPLGRMAHGTSAASAYPGATANTVNLDESATDATSFGPTVPTPGAGSFR